MLKIKLTGKFSNYELHCENGGKIYCFNHKDESSELIGKYNSMFTRMEFRGGKYKSLKKWLNRQVKKDSMSDTLAMQSQQQIEANIAFFFSIKGYVREYRLKVLDIN